MLKQNSTHGSWDLTQCLCNNFPHCGDGTAWFDCHSRVHSLVWVSFFSQVANIHFPLYVPVPQRCHSSSHTRWVVTRSRFFFSFHHKPLGVMNALTLAYLWMLGASETVSSLGAPYLWSAKKASLRLREPTPSLAIWRKARWCGVVSFPSAKVWTAEKRLTSVCLVRNKAQIKKESSCKSTAVDAVWP